MQWFALLQVEYKKKISENAMVGIVAGKNPRYGAEFANAET